MATMKTQNPLSRALRRLGLCCALTETMDITPRAEYLTNYGGQEHSFSTGNGFRISNVRSVVVAKEEPENPGPRLSIGNQFLIASSILVPEPNSFALAGMAARGVAPRIRTRRHSVFRKDFASVSLSGERP
jgi:hypothetical protein